jgi:Raf kinase inhibitor-like YbhB/YbcL family protein
MVFQLRSSAFDNKGSIPANHTCKGEEVSPPLNWSDPPRRTESFAVIMEDVDAPIGTITHWVLYNIPSEKRELQEAVPHQKSFPDGTIQGRNGMRKNRYMGPCPPFGMHRYYFKIFALDTVLEPDHKVNKKKLLRLMEGHILDKSQLMGLYSKNPK